MQFRSFILIAFSLTLLGCQTSGQPSGQRWNAISSKDEFTDKVTKMVTVGERLSTSLITTYSLKYYPFVGIQDGELYVGIRSGGRIRVPTGTVQLRIDDNPAWTISPDETPVNFIPLLSSPTTVKATTTADNQPDVTATTTVNTQEIQKKMIENITKIMSPYTAVTGNKARSIVKEMLHGKVIKYRTIGLNQAASTTGEVIIDDSFEKSLRLIGLNSEDF